MAFIDYFSHSYNFRTTVQTFQILVKRTMTRMELVMLVMTMMMMMVFLMTG